MRYNYFAFLFILSAGMGLSACMADAAENNLKFSGTLVSEPCDLDPLTTDIIVDFGTVIEKSLYLNTRTNSKPVIINLINCDASLGNQVSMTFTGSESTALPGMLAVTGTATGIAIGMEEQDGTPLPFNKATPLMALKNGTNRFTFQVYVEGESEAIKSQAITPGTFTAVATVEMNYP